MKLFTMAEYVLAVTAQLFFFCLLATYIKSLVSFYFHHYFYLVLRFFFIWNIRAFIEWLFSEQEGANESFSM